MTRIFFLTKTARLWRWFRLLWQQIYRGWNDSVTWDLGGFTAHWLLPRLRRFKELNNGHPGDLTEESWDAMLDDMIYAMEICERQLVEGLLPEEADWDRVERGLKAFGERFRDLWW